MLQPYNAITADAFSQITHPKRRQSLLLRYKRGDTIPSGLLDQKTLQPNSEPEVLSEDPLVLVVRDFLSHEECETIRDYVQSIQKTEDRQMSRSNPPEVSIDVRKLWPLPFMSLIAAVPPILHHHHETNLSQLVLTNIFGALVASLALTYGVVLPFLRYLSKSTSRTSEAIALNREDDFETIRFFVDRVSTFTKHPWEKWEAPVVTRYEPGAIFARHGDASPTKGSEWRDLGGQRIVTSICYLNTLSDKDGGETYFDKLKFGVTPKAGSLLVFFPADKNTLQADQRTIHESLPPNQEKWIIQMFGRVKRVPPPLGIEERYSEE